MNSPRIRVKICGLTGEDDVRLAVDAGATHVGFVLVPGTPRYVSVKRAAVLVRAVPPHVTPVLVFRTSSPSFVKAAVAVTGVGHVQLHRSPEESALALEARGLVVHRVVEAGRFPGLDGILGFLGRGERVVHVDRGHGGEGRPFDWKILAPRAPRRVFVAGGITPRNLPALLCYRPWGIDVGSGIESRPGVKDPRLVADLFAVLRHAPAPEGDPAP